MCASVRSPFIQPYVDVEGALVPVALAVLGAVGAGHHAVSLADGDAEGVDALEIADHGDGGHLEGRGLEQDGGAVYVGGIVQRAVGPAVSPGRGRHAVVSEAPGASGRRKRRAGQVLWGRFSFLRVSDTMAASTPGAHSDLPDMGTDAIGL